MTLRFGAGALQWGRPRESRADGVGRCLTTQASPFRCASIRAKAGEAVGPSGWRWTASDTSPGDYGSFVEDPGWSCLTPSHSWVWAVRVDRGGGIDVIDAAGHVKTVLSTDAVAAARRACVVETARGPLLVSESEHTDGGYEQRALVATQGAWSLGPSQGLPLATYGRTSLRGRAHIVHGGANGLTASHWLTDAGELSDSWLLLHDEMPERRCPIVITCPEEDSGKARMSLFSPKGKLLRSASFSGSAFSPFPGDDPPRLDLGPEGVTAFARDNLLTASRALATPTRKPHSGAASRPIPGTPAEELVATGFEPALGEGIALVKRGAEALARRFDANGTPLGEATTGPWGAATSPVWAAGGWLVRNGAEFTFVTGPARGRRVPFGTPDAAQLVERSGRDVVVLVTKVRVYLVDARTGRSRSCWLPDGHHRPLGVLPDAVGAPLLALANDIEALAWRCRDDGVGERVEHPGTVALNQALLQRRLILGVADVFRDRVVVASGSPPVGVWLSAGTTSALGVPLRAEGALFARAVGPLLHGRSLVLPSRPGPLAEVSGMHASLAKSCRQGFATGERRVLLVCEESARADLPGVSVTLRVHRR